MRKFLLFLLFIGYLGASERYISIHQIDTRSGSKNFKDQILNAGLTLKLKTDYLPYDTSYRIICKDDNCIQIKNPHKQNWCNTHWMRYRVYVPSHTKKLNVFFYVRNNSSHAGFMYFIPDGSSLRSVDFRNFKFLYEKYYNRGYDFETSQESAEYLFGGYNPLFFALYNIDGSYTWENISSYTQSGGWLYITLAQADQIMDSDEGFKYDPKIKLYVNYEFDDSDKMEWLRYIKFDSYGDPVENFSTLQEIQKACSGTVVTLIQGNNEGEYIFDPNIPSFTVKQTPHSSTIDYDIEFKAGESPVEGVNPDANSNITISAEMNECIGLRSQPLSNHENGEFFYSDDQKNWTSEYKPGYRYIRYELAPADSSQVVLAPHDMIKLDLSVQKENCTNAKVHFEAQYSLDGQVQQKEQTMEYVFQVTSSTTTSTSSSSSRSSSSDDSLTDEAAEQQECESNGGRWLDHLCFYPSSSSSSSSSSQNSSIEENASSSSYSSNENISSSSETSRLRAYQIAAQLAGKSYNITGYFIYYGDWEDYDKFAWIYANKSLSLVSKLEGSTPEGGFKWTRLMSNKYNIHVFDQVTIEDGVVKFGNVMEPSAEDQSIESSSSQTSTSSAQETSSSESAEVSSSSATSSSSSSSSHSTASSTPATPHL